MNEVVEKRTRKIKEVIRRLKEIKEKGKESFLSDWMLQDAAIRNFEVGIECLIDIGNHIISEKKWETPESYREVVKILEKHGVIPPSFSPIAEKMISFRNILVHEYLYVDPGKVYENLSLIKDMEMFLKYLLDYI